MANERTWERKAHSAIRKSFIRMDECIAFRRGTLGIATRNTRRLLAGIRRRAIRQQNVTMICMCDDAMKQCRWEQ